MKTIRTLTLLTCALWLSMASFAQYEVAVEIESVAAAGSWVKSTDLTGYSGNSYYYWSAGTSFGSPPAGSDLVYNVSIPSDGTYQIYLRGMRKRGACGCPADAANDRCNDVWLKIGNHEWMKKMVKQGWGNWIWDGKWEIEGAGVKPATIHLTAGTHTVRISGRSLGVMLDALVITKSTNAAPTGTLDGSTPPPPPPPTNDCESYNGLWKGKGRIAISSDGNEHDHDDWAATPLSLALLAAKGLQDQLVLYTYSDHIWGSDDQHGAGSGKTSIGAKAEMIESAIGGKEKFGFDNSTFIEAVSNKEAAYDAMAAAIDASSADDPLFIIGAGPMHVIRMGLERSNSSKHNFITIISHSTWNENHANKDHNGMSWPNMKTTFSNATFVDILDQNGGNDYDGLRAPKAKFDWIKNSPARTHEAYKAGSWDWLYARQETVVKSGDFDPSDAGMIVYFLTGIEKTEPSDAKDIMESPLYCGVTCTAAATLDGYTDFAFPAAAGEFGAKGSKDNGRSCAQINTNQEAAGEWARATATFNGESGSYKLKFNSLLEHDGESEYKVKVNGTVVMEVTNIRIPSKDRDYEIYETESDSSITVNAGDAIQVEFLSATNGLYPEEGAPQGTAWARARWKSVEFTTCSSTPPPPPPSCIKPTSVLGDGTDYDHTVYKAMSLPGVINVEDHDDGGQGVSYEDKGWGNTVHENGMRAAWSLDRTPNVRPDVLLDFDTATAAKPVSPTDVGVFLGGVRQGEWAEYTVNVAQPGDYTLTKIRYSTNSNVSSCKVYFKMDDSVSCVFDLNTTGTNTQFVEYDVNYTFEGLDAGKHIFAWVSETDKWNIDNFTFEFGGQVSLENNIAENTNMTVYPNPFKNTLTVKTNSDAIMIYSIAGQRMSTEITRTGNGFEINTENLLNGIYFIHDGQSVQKIIKN